MTNFFLQATVFGLCIYLCCQGNIFNSVDAQNTRMVTDLVKDWAELPFTKITVQDEMCDVDTKPVFSRVWGGTEQGCWVENTLYWNGN